MIVEHNRFTSIVNTRAIELAAFASIEIKKKAFSDFHTSERGGAIILR